MSNKSYLKNILHIFEIKCAHNRENREYICTKHNDRGTNDKIPKGRYGSYVTLMRVCTERVYDKFASEAADTDGE